LRRGVGQVYWQDFIISVAPALYGFASAFNRAFLGKMPTIIVQGPPGQGKTRGLIWL
jgi:Cdc6-like AAA superfamily ATPase